MSTDREIRDLNSVCLPSSIIHIWILPETLITGLAITKMELVQVTVLLERCDGNGEKRSIDDQDSSSKTAEEIHREEFTVA